MRSVRSHCRAVPRSPPRRVRPLETVSVEVPVGPPRLAPGRPPEAGCRLPIKTPSGQWYRERGGGGLAVRGWPVQARRRSIGGRSCWRRMVWRPACGVVSFSVIIWLMVGTVVGEKVTTEQPGDDAGRITRSGRNPHTRMEPTTATLALPATGFVQLTQVPKKLIPLGRA